MYAGSNPLLMHPLAWSSKSGYHRVSGTPVVTPGVNPDMSIEESTLATVLLLAMPVVSPAVNESTDIDERADATDEEPEDELV